MQLPEGVSAREAEVLAAIRGHQSNAQIATRLQLSVRTVESHVSSLLRKAGVPDRRSLAALADTLDHDAGLPAFPTSFVGRDRERDDVREALRDARLVTLVGAGGMGKTRLAVDVAAGLDVDVVFVDLVPVRAGGVARAVAQALGADERAPGTPADAVVNRLRSAPAVVLLDNGEHVAAEAGALVARILRSCPEARVLATSRERLAVPGERLVTVASLGAAAERLFVERARAVDADLAADPATVTRLCSALDGMPLAIELAAARTASLGVEGVLAALDDRLRLVSGSRGPDDRHHSLDAVYGWSLDLLDDDERALFARLGTFVGAFDLDAAATLSPDLDLVATADLLGRLVDRSLVVRQPGHPGPHWSLLATARAVALREPAAGDDEVRRHYVRWAVEAAGRLEARVDELDPAEHDAVADDLRNALVVAAERGDERADGLARSSAHLTFARGHVVAARELYRTAADLAADPGVGAADLRTAAAAALTVSDGETGFMLLTDAAELARQAGDDAAAAVALGSAVVAATRLSMSFGEAVSYERVTAMLDEAEALHDPADEHAAAVLATARAWAASPRPLDPDLPLSRAAASAARRTGDVALVLGALDALGTALANAGRLREAHDLSEERLRLAASASRHEPEVAAEVVDLFHVASTSAVAAGDLPAAVTVVERADRTRPVGTHPSLVAPRMVRLRALTGDLDDALAHADVLWDGWIEASAAGEGAELAALLGDWPASAAALAAMSHGLRGDVRSFEEWQARARRIARVDTASQSAALAAPAAFADARVATHTGRGDASTLVAAALAPFAEQWWLPYAHASGAELAVVAGLPDAEQRLADAAPAADENDWAAACVARATARHTGDATLMADAAGRWERLGARFEHAVTLALLPTRAAEGRAELARLGTTLPADSVAGTDDARQTSDPDSVPTEHTGDDPGSR